MKVEAEELINYHCPRWNELPEIELYIDQVICVLQSNLSIFSKFSSYFTVFYDKITKN